MLLAPWYLNQESTGLDHQRIRKLEQNCTKLRRSRGAKGHQATKYRKCACTNCGAVTHDSKSCTDRPRKLGAKFTGKHIAAGETIEQFDLNFDTKHDSWNGFDS